MREQPKPEFFNNRKEQLQIEEAVILAIKPGMYYHNIVIALANMLRHYAQQMVKDDAPGEMYEEGR